MSDREVVITGMGLVTSLGKNVEENWDNIKALKCGINHYPEEGLPENFQYYGKVTQFEIPDNVPPKLLNQVKFLNRGSLLGFRSAQEAASQSRMDLSNVPPSRRALYIASGDFTKLDHKFMYPATKDGTNGKWNEIDFEKLNKSTLNKVNPFFLLESIKNNLFSFLSAYFEFMGPNTSLASLSPCGLNALELAHRSIRQNKADIALVVGYGNWITEIPRYEIEGLGMLSKGKHGARSFRPFDRNRDGFLPGEGGGAIFLESLETAKQRDAEIFGSIGNFGNCFELPTSGAMSVSSNVIKRSVQVALEEADCDINDLAFINLHGSGTKKGDRAELKSIAEVLGNKKTELPLCGLKPYTGHIGAASDIAEIIIGIEAATNGIIPGTLNFNKAEKEFSEMRISSAHQRCGKKYFLSISYGIGGQSTSVIVKAA